MKRLPSRHKLATALLLCSAAQPLTASAINSAQIIASALSPTCLEYRVVGICYWLFCTPWGCKVRTSVKVKHYIPNAVVSSYAQTGENPWSEVAMLGTGIPGVAEGGGHNEQKRVQRKDNLRFKNADAIGHPALAAPSFNNFLGVMGYTCPSSATAFVPYFLSTLDALMWRTGLPESLYPEALTPGLREVGSSLNMWGNVYPRSGFVTQVDDYKAAAVVAQRTADIITRTGQVHVYNPMTASKREGYWPPGSVTENTGTKNHKWQRLAPSISSSCAVFPDNSNPIAADGAYAWALWQPYSCCQKRGQRFLYSTDF
ncbi:integrating conjugative element protein, PFL_4710 family [Serratia fonticola]|uniref:Integrating conjugative element protein, PFL_4710 family n=1 Tax=Serratia fonticola TaxID=47917 RepID=A0A0F7H7C2_SERFO|nr:MULTISPECIES: TIGR03756 family integrating conjugative element protein [Serratia]AKG68264.1 conjugal transfer protein [Serratia fonticola]CAI1526239.1 integrating conjugative element protein, PFL_4710 family [Serratia fonticola]VTR59271.1 integrating conjugative element protein, PFL_4710 family [Serratia fonticola]